MIARGKRHDGERKLTKVGHDFPRAFPILIRIHSVSFLCLEERSQGSIRWCFVLIRLISYEYFVYDRHYSSDIGWLKHETRTKEIKIYKYTINIATKKETFACIVDKNELLQIRKISIGNYALIILSASMLTLQLFFNVHIPEFHRYVHRYVCNTRLNISKYKLRVIFQYFAGGTSFWQ